MQILVIPPDESPVIAEIDRILKAMQKIVSGTIHVVYPFVEDLDPICNDKGKVRGLPLNL